MSIRHTVLALVVGTLAATLSITALVDSEPPAAEALAAPSAPLEPEPVAHPTWLPPALAPAVQAPPKAKPKPKPKPVVRKDAPSRSQTRESGKPGWGVQYSKAQVRAILEQTAPSTADGWEISAGVCIALRESHGWTRVRNFAGSSATGLWQFLRGTWGGFKGYPDARSAPPVVQAQKFWRLWDNGSGRGHWAGGQYACW